MSRALWTAVDDYIGNSIVRQDYALQTALEESRAAGLPPYNISAPQGQFLHILARSINARRILEIGTLGGYSTIWLARALPPDGRLITLEYEPRHAAVARENLERAGVSSQVEVRVGAALDRLPTLERENLGPFDLFFIDADKANIPAYFDWALRLARVGAIIIIDNVVRDGEVANAQSRDASVLGVRRLMERMRDERRISATALQSVGSKGYDGFAIALVTDAG